MTDDLLPFGAPADADAAKLPVPVPGTRGGVREGAGRKPGSTNKVNRDLRNLCVAQTGREAIVEHYRLAAMPVMSEDEAVAEEALDALTRRFRCTRLEALDRVQRAAQLVFPHVYPKLGQLELRPPGAVDAGPLFEWDIDGTAVEVESGDGDPDPDGTGEAVP